MSACTHTQVQRINEAEDFAFDGGCIECLRGELARAVEERTKAEADAAAMREALRPFAALAVSEDEGTEGWDSMVRAGRVALKSDAGAALLAELEAAETLAGAVRVSGARAMNVVEDALQAYTSSRHRRIRSRRSGGDAEGSAG